MNKPTEPKRFPAWLRGLGWLAFGILGLVTVLLVGRWLVMNGGHQEAMGIVKAQQKKPVARIAAATATAAVQAGATQCMSLASVPFFGEVLTGDEKGWKDLSKKIDEMNDFLRHKRTLPEKVDGVWSFRAILQNMGTNVPETMTEAEAAAEYLRQADRFSGLLAQWREAVLKGPLDKVTDDSSDPNIWRFSNLAYTFSRLLTMTAEARLHAGDTAAAWADWQTLKNSTERVSELFPTGSGHDGLMTYQMFGLARSGVQSGAWTDDQLTELSSVAARENILSSVLREQEREKKSITDYYTHFHEHEEQFSKDFLKTPSPFNQMMNQVKLKLITDQQIQDNLDMRLYEVDQRLSRFDPETGFYVQPAKDDLTETKASSDVVGSFYFMISDLNGGHGDGDQTARDVIRFQSEYDQLRLAAALETYQHRTGSYPDHLEAVSGQFPNGAPLDIATGQPYFYQRDADGGYNLWGTGIDGKSEGGNEKTDITWKHRPVKRK